MIQKRRHASIINLFGSKLIRWIHVNASYVVSRSLFFPRVCIDLHFDIIARLKPIETVAEVNQSRSNLLRTRSIDQSSHLRKDDIRLPTMSGLRSFSHFYERKCYLCETRTVYPDREPAKRVRFSEPITSRMLRSASPRYPNRGDDIRVIRLTADQEAVLQEQFNRWPRAPHTADIVLLAAETGLSEADVEAWYAIRLAQWRKEQGLGGNLGLH